MLDVLIVGELLAVMDGQAEGWGEEVAADGPIAAGSPKGLGEMRLVLLRFLAGVRAGGAE